MKKSNTRALEILNNTIGYPNFRLNQEEIISSFISKKNTLGLMPTGGGKSVCFQIPAIIFSEEVQGVSIVISPLISLMKDQVDAAKELGIKAEFINSTTKAEGKRLINKRLFENDVDLLYISPERAVKTLDYIFDNSDTIEINSFAIDEAHCISQWGHDFRPDYKTVCDIILDKVEMTETLLDKTIPIIALTATADIRTREDIKNKLNIKDENSFISSFYRPNIKIQSKLKNKNGFLQIQALLNEYKGKTGIIYTNTKKEAEKIANEFNLYAYHSQITMNDREKIQNAFIAGDIEVIVATTAFGMGIDKSNIEFVIHSSIPYSVGDWYQQIGRAGRDGRDAVATTLYHPSDAYKIYLINKMNKNKLNMESILDVYKIVSSKDCIWNQILSYFDEELDEECDNCSTCHTTLEENKLIPFAIDESAFTIYGEDSMSNLSDIIYKSLKDYKRVKAPLKKEISHYIVNEMTLYGLFDISFSPTSYKPLNHYFTDTSEKFELYTLENLYVSDFEFYADNTQYIGNKADLKTDYDIKINHNVSDKAFSSRKRKTKKKVENIDTSSMSMNEELFNALMIGRIKKKGRSKKPLFRILKEETLRDIAKIIPKNKSDLINIKGFGSSTLRKNYQWVLEITNQY